MLFRSDIQTSGFSISPRYTQPPDSGRIEGEAPRIAGYSVFNNLTVRVRNLAQIGAILDRAVSLGVNSGGDIRFTNSDTAKILAEARKAAVKDAMARAATLAEAAGVRLGPILEITENYSPPGPIPLQRSVAYKAEAAVPVESGENTYTATVQVTWEILQ